MNTLPAIYKSRSGWGNLFPGEGKRVDEKKYTFL